MGLILQVPETGQQPREQSREGRSFPATPPAPGNATAMGFRGTPLPDTCTRKLKPQSRLQLKYFITTKFSITTRDYPVYTQLLKSDGEFTKKCQVLSSW